VKVTPTGVDNQELLTGWHVVAPWSNVYNMDKPYGFTLVPMLKTKMQKPMQMLFELQPKMELKWELT